MMSTIDHIAILVDDLDVAEEWYAEHMSAKVTFKDTKYVRMQVENTNIALINKKYYKSAHFAILVNNYEDLPLSKGTIVKHRDGTVGVYVKDPFGNYIEYIWYSDDQKGIFLS